MAVEVKRVAEEEQRRAEVVAMEASRIAEEKTVVAKWNAVLEVGAKHIPRWKRQQWSRALGCCQSCRGRWRESGWCVTTA